MISIQKLSNDHVKPIPMQGGEDNRPVLGAALFPEPYSNIFLVAKKKSGKTSAIFHILKRCVGKNTALVIFCSTIYNDKNWIAIRKYFKDKGTPIEAFSSIYEGGVDLIAKLVKNLEEEAKAEEEDSDEELDPKEILRQQGGRQAMAIYNHNTKERGPRKPRKPKYLAPEYIIVLDDLSTELKAPSLVALLKQNRHFLSKVIVSTQYLKDILPASRKMMDNWLVFRGMNEKKLETIYEDSDVDIDEKEFNNLYARAVSKPYAFFYIDTNMDEFRQNFTHKYLYRRKIKS